MKKTITRIFSAIALSILALSAACAAPEEPVPTGETPATRTQPTATTPPAAARNQPANQPAQTTVILENQPTLFPTRERPQRLDLTDAMAAVSPTNTPEPTPTETMLNTPTAIPEEVAEPHMTEMMPTGPATEASGIPAVPENPQLDDSVRVQDIYQFTDLSQYALNPESYPPISEGVEDIKKHPYRFLTPGTGRSIIPDREKDEYFRNRPINDRSPISYFIRHPWFEEAYYPQYAVLEENTSRNSTKFRYKNKKPESIQRNESNYRELPLFEGIGPRWFGDNSLKGVLLQSVANTLEQAVKPGSEKMTLTWKKVGFFRGPDNTTELDLTIEEYISVTANNLKESKHSENIEEIRDKYGNIDDVFATPEINWSFVHPELPIIRITAEYQTLLPLTTPGTNLSDQQPTRFRTSTVVAFQNRWDSFTDPNRWLIRFRPYYELGDYYKKHRFVPYDKIPSEDYPRWIEMALAKTPSAYGLSDPEHWELFPFYWHASDYMPHSIIGPVVTEVIESDVLEPGIYSHTPRITQWTAPGPILTTEQLSDYYADIHIEYTVLEGKEEYMTDERSGRQVLNPESIVFETEHDFLAPRTGPSPYGPNPNFPFPGHLSASEYHLPGSEGWDYFDLDSVDWDW